MADIIDITKYKLQKKDKTIVSEVSEEKLANKILDSLNFNNRNREIPIVKIAKNYGFRVYYEKFNQNNENDIAGKLLVGGNTKDLYKCTQVILVNGNDDLYDQRVVIARILACYIMERANNTYYNTHKNIPFSTILSHEEIYNKYEEFVLNILAPSQIFVREHNHAVNGGLLRIGLYMYLSRYFEVPDEFVQRRIKSLRKPNSNNI